MGSNVYRKLNLKELSLDTNPAEVCKALGVRVFPKGRQNFICCPGHEKRLGKRDLNPTNAVLMDNGYHCFACGVSVSTADMITEITGCTLHEAFQFMANLNGGMELYHMDGNEMMHLRYSDEELKSLKINPLYGAEISFLDLCIKAPDLAREIVRERINNLLPKYEVILEKTLTEEGAMMLYEYAHVSSKKRNEMLEEVKKRIQILKVLKAREEKIWQVK